MDKVLKKVLITHERKEILQNYEKIMLDEHFTNLYAPRKQMIYINNLIKYYYNYTIDNIFRQAWN